MISYFLYVIAASVISSPIAIGPFHGLLACEKAASQVLIISREAKREVHTVCLSQKAANFKP